MARKKTHDGGIPPHVVNQLIEHTIGGFMLFYFNNETGEPEQIMTFDTPAHSLALQKYIADWQDAVEQINHEVSVNSIQRSIIEANKSSQTSEDEDEDGEEGEEGAEQER
jgi:hypothetical protein